MRGAFAVVLVFCSLAIPAFAQQQGDSGVNDEAAKAKVLFEKNDFQSSLPLYEDLHAKQPGSLVFEERLAMCLLAKAGGQPQTEGDATRARAKAMLLDAKAHGDDSNLLQILLEKLNDGDAARKAEGPAAPKPLGHEWVDKAEAAFTAGDLTTALVDYQKALDVNPKYYAAALFAGDTEFKQGHAAEAGVWFAKAIAIDPDQETAYRYWGDTLEKAGEHKRAEDEFIQAVVAQPYQRAARLGLKQWADRNHARVVPPAITLPKRAVPDAKGNTNITVDPSTMGSPASSAWLAYSIAPTVWRNGMFAKTYPNEKVYRHSLAEETQAIEVALGAVKDKKVIENDATLRALAALQKDGMLQCWILLDDADQGIAQDYVAYRKEHRDLMAQYIAKYDVHPM